MALAAPQSHTRNRSAAGGPENPRCVRPMHFSRSLVIALFTLVASHRLNRTGVATRKRAVPLTAFRGNEDDPALSPERRSRSFHLGRRKAGQHRHICYRCGLPGSPPPD